MKAERCETCRYWDIANAMPGHERMMHFDDDCMQARPPHADLNWSVCAAAKEGFSFETSEQHAETLSGKMAVFDGSSYYACLYTRFDHGCREHKPREEARD